MRLASLSRLAIILALGCISSALAADRDLRVGRSFHAFDHLSDISAQSEAAAASGVNIIYATGLGGCGYMGLPNTAELARQHQDVAAYNQSARRAGIRLIIGYVCATSIVKLDQFDAHWSADFRKQFKTPPAEWRQQGRDGKPLPSWYGGDYQPACMNNPDWRAYEKFVVRQQMTSGHDGIFFDNPTVHPQGCYCPHCMTKFAGFLRAAGISVPDFTPEALRKLADERPKDFLRFRATTARDFLAEMRQYARTLKSGALMTCNNSLNSPEVLFSQARTYGYNIFEKSKAEDLVVVEDQSHQPRLLTNGRTLEYGPTYRQLAAISHGKPIIAVTIAENDYHTPPNLVRLAMAEAAAHEASYLAWPTWPEAQRTRMANAIRPQADFLKSNEKFLNDTTPREDVLLFLPLQRWTETDKCIASQLAATLTARNVQYRVIIEDDLAAALKSRKSSPLPVPALVLESRTILTPDQQNTIAAFEKTGGKVIVADQPNWKDTLPSSVTINTTNVRAIVREQSGRTLVHLYNLGIARLSSFEDRVDSVTNLTLRVRLPATRARSVTALTADPSATSGKLPYTVERKDNETALLVRLPKLDINTILVINR